MGITNIEIILLEQIERILGKVTLGGGFKEENQPGGRKRIKNNVCHQAKRGKSCKMVMKK